MDSRYVAEFEDFHQRWVMGQEQLLGELLCLIDTDAECTNQGREGEEEDPGWIRTVLISRALVQFGEYYEARSRLMERDAFVMFFPRWLNPFERSFLWITGFRPSIVFRIVDRLVGGQTTEQSRSLEQLREEVKAEEEQLGLEMTWIQNFHASAYLVAEHVRRLPGRAIVNGQLSPEILAVERLRTVLGATVDRADGLRRKAVVRVVQIVSPAQGIKFLAGLIQFQLRMRSWGNPPTGPARATPLD